MNAMTRCLPLLFVWGCSGSSTPATTLSEPFSSEIVAFSRITNLTPVEVAVGTAKGWGFVDTGDPEMELDPATFPTVPTSGVLAAVTVGSLTVDKVEVIGSSDGLGSPDPSFPLAANVGCGALCGRVASFNYRDVAFTLGSAAPSSPANLLPEIAQGFSFEGGTQGNVPRSRVIVTVSIEGTNHVMMLDTGASLVVVNAQAFASITSDGRAQLDTGSVETTQGESTSALTRVHSIALGTAEVDSVVISHDTEFDTILDTISKDVGFTVEGSLGGTFLNHFYVTLDYPNDTVHLAPYSSTSFAIDPAESLGLSFETEPMGGGYVIGGVSSTSDAASKGVVAGDIVVAIDGQSLGSLTLAEAAVLSFGAVGSTKVVTFESGLGGAMQSVPIQVEEFLPL